MSRRAYIFGLLAALLVATTLRVVWLTADPPTDARGGVGIVWHDEGAWTHNARNRALWGVWRTDNWNPVFVAPVFTALESIAFRAWGVGTWQARTVPAASGLLAILALVAGLSAASGRRAALFAAWLLAANYVFVMWNRAALMDSTMTAWIVVSWAAYAMASKRPWWALVSGIAAVLAWFTKASAAFFVAALMLDALFAIGRSRMVAGDAVRRAEARVARLTLVGLAAGALVIVAVFVVPHWREYTFYNWQMSVTRKPVYTFAAFKRNASWLPIVSDFFTRMWLVLIGAALAIAGIAARWRAARAADRLLVLWVLVGLVELVVHGAGEERYYVPLIPALIALASMVVTSRGPLLPASPDSASGSSRWLALPLVLGLGYLVVGSVARLAFLDRITAGDDRGAVWTSASVVIGFAAALMWTWPRAIGWLSRGRVPVRLATALLLVAVGWNLIEYRQWTRARTYFNYWASVEIGGLLPPGTLVHGKLANGLSLNNRIRPIFIGNHFGNYDDRLERDDARYILTYTAPRLGYESGPEGRLIQDLLDHYPGHRTLATFDVAETGGPDRAALIDKFPAQRGGRARD
jgi:4-amino-4-deoxy-L-arabinose transferase-like glycosyltransferase